MTEIPWRDRATLVRLGIRSDDTAEILFEGTLAQMVRRVSLKSSAERSRLRISLPDRRVRPFSFEGAALTTLIEQEIRRPIV